MSKWSFLYSHSSPQFLHYIKNMHKGAENSMVCPTLRINYCSYCNSITICSQ